MFEKPKKKPYVSCIKLNGSPILPPVITPERRKELLGYKQQAIKLELRLKTCRDLKKNLDNLKNSHPILTDRSQNSEITYKDNSHIEALGIKDKVTSQITPFKLKKSLNLSKDIIDVTEYNSNGIKIIYSESETNEYKLNGSNETDSSLNKSVSLESTNITEQHVEFQNDKQSDSPPKPRLIRSNSYTLDNPSPILIAHLQNNSKNLTKNWASVENTYVPNSTENSEFSSINTVYHNVGKEDKCSNNFTVTTSTPRQSNQSPRDYVSNMTGTTSSPRQTNENFKGYVKYQNVDKEVLCNDNNILTDRVAGTVNDVKSPTIEVYQTDISVQQITVNTLDNEKQSLDNKSKKEKFLTEDAFDICNPESQLMQVLQKIPETYSAQIIELLKNQKEEQKERLERFDKIQNKNKCASTQNDNLTDSVKNLAHSNIVEDVKNWDTSINSTVQNYNTRSSNLGHWDSTVKNWDSTLKNDNLETPDEVSTKLNRSSTFSLSPSQSIYYSVTGTSNTLTPNESQTPSVKLIDLESESESGVRTSSVRSVARQPEIRCDSVLSYTDILEESNRSGVSRELFPSKFEMDTLNVIKREWAASIIGAYVKGYLTRRLLKTEKVVNLIETIKDALTCALQLHTADNVDESDVELHRRLIQQVSAACYAFYDIFFALSTREQMQIISADRQRKIEKAKRPTSAPTSRRSASSSRSSLRSSSGRLDRSLGSQSRSLTKV